MTYIAATLAGAALAATSTFAAAELLDRWQFRVLLDDKPIGQHQFELRASGDGRELVSRADFKVSFWVFDAYRYQHVATERWRGDCLESLVARTDDNGDVETVRAERKDERFTVVATNTRSEHRGCVRSFAYWNPAILAGGRLLNAQTGEVLPVTATPLGEETITVRGRPEQARRYRLTGKDIDIHLWYADGNDWVALESETRGGRLLRYTRM